MNPHAPYAQRRAQLLNHIGPDGIAVVFAAPEQRRSNDTDFPYRQDSYFYYLTGFTEPEAVLVLDGREGLSILYCRDKDPERETWDGFRYGPHAAQALFGLDAAHTVDEWPHDFLDQIKGHRQLWALWGLYPQHDQSVLKLWQQVQQMAGQRAASGSTVAPDALMDLAKPLNRMRLFKEPAEMELLRRAAQISAEAHIRAMQRTRPGVWEYQIEAEMLYHFMQHGARYPAYNSIVAGGRNACCLHYVENKDVLCDGDLLLIDAGAEYCGYAGDITRTFPVNGRFSGAQKDLYEVVLAANEASIAAIKPGVNWQAVSDASVRILTQGLLDLHLLSGSLEQNITLQNYRRFYMHGIGHWIGLDVHDVGGRFEGEAPILLQENMCTTVEPGLYINPADDIPKHFHGIGIRIEDNVRVSATGVEVYTASVPKSIADIESLMRN